MQKALKKLVDADVYKLIISNPTEKSNQFRKIVIEKKKNGYQSSKYTDKLLGDTRYTSGELNCDGLIAAHADALEDYKKRKKQIILQIYFYFLFLFLLLY